MFASAITAGVSDATVDVDVAIAEDATGNAALAAIAHVANAT